MNFGLVKYYLKGHASREYCKSGFRISRSIKVAYELCEKIRYQISLGARIISLNLSYTEYATLDEKILGPHLEILILC